MPIQIVSQGYYISYFDKSKQLFVGILWKGKYKMLCFAAVGFFHWLFFRGYGIVKAG